MDGYMYELKGKKSGVESIFVPLYFLATRTHLFDLFVIKINDNATIQFEVVSVFLLQRHHDLYVLISKLQIMYYIF